MQVRHAEYHRQTRETDIRLSINLDALGDSQVKTGIGFFDHMLDQVARHGLFDLSVDAMGDLHIDDHHLVEDTGIALGKVFSEAVGDKRGIRRYGWAVVPLDEALVLVSLDLSGRGGYFGELGDMDERVGQFSTSLVSEFYRAFAVSAGVTLHVRTLCGQNTHHVIEASFKAFARALREAVTMDERVVGVPSTKGVL